MRKTVSCVILAAFVWSILLQDIAFVQAAPNSGGGGGKYSLAVLDLEASGRVSIADARKLTERLRAELEKTGIFEMMDQSHINSTVESSRFGETGCGSVECALQIGRTLGAKLVTNGAINKVGPLYFLEVSIIHVKSGQTVQTVSEDIDGDFRAVEDRMPAFARKLIGSTAQGTAAATKTSGAEPSAQMAPAEQSAAATTGEEEVMTTNSEKSGGSSKVLIVGLIAAGVIGGGIAISQALKNDDGNGGDKPDPVGALPDHPEFP